MLSVNIVKEPQKSSNDTKVTPAADFDMLDYRCNCGKLLFRGTLQTGIVAVKCKRCRSIMTFVGGEDRRPIKVELSESSREQL